MTKFRYVGIADAHGIESFKQQDKGVPVVLTLRASANRQRHALVYEVFLTQKQVDKVNEMIKADRFKDALVFLKLRDTFAVEESMRRSADMIPNDALDPYWNQ